MIAITINKPGIPLSEVTISDISIEVLIKTIVNTIATVKAGICGDFTFFYIGLTQVVGDGLYHGFEQVVFWSLAERLRTDDDLVLVINRCNTVIALYHAV